jgi:hypothetical protein
MPEQQSELRKATSIAAVRAKILFLTHVLPSRFAKVVERSPRLMKPTEDLDSGYGTWVFQDYAHTWDTSISWRGSSGITSEGSLADTGLFRC